MLDLEKPLVSDKLNKSDAQISSNSKAPNANIAVTPPEREENSVTIPFDEKEDVEKQVRSWMEKVLKQEIVSNGDSFLFNLTNGVHLCNLANTCIPDSVPRVNPPSDNPFKQMENITSFLKASRAAGVQPFDVCGSTLIKIDLTEY